LRIPADRISVLPNAIDLDRIRRLAAEPFEDLSPDGRPLLVNVARFTYAKDHTTLLHAFARVRTARPSTLVLVGSGEDEAHVRALCTRLDLDRDVVFAGFTRNPYRVLARATVSVLSSRFEGLPNSVIESMALGIPVVSTACPYGPLELLGGRDDRGVLVPVGDPIALADAIVALLDDEPRRRAFAAGGLRHATEFDQHLVAGRYEALFEAFAARGSRASAAAVTAGQGLGP
jgi:glycosyltransferase involved in cell wall biosynthesis